MEVNYKKLEWLDLLSNKGKVREVVPVLQKMPVAELGEILQELSNEDLLEILPMFSPDQQGLIVSEFDITRQLNLFQHTSRKWFARIYENMVSDIRVDLFQHFTYQEKISFLPYLTKNTREDVLKLSAYEPDSAGGIMSTDFATVRDNITCAQAIEKVRSDAPSKMVYYIYAVDNEMKLKGFLTIKDLILADTDTLVSDIMFTEFSYSTLDEDREAVAKKLKNMTWLPSLLSMIRVSSWVSFIMMMPSK